MDRMAGLTTLTPLYPVAVRNGSTVAGEGVDIKGLADNLLVLLDSTAGGGADHTLNLTIQHRADATDTWNSVPAAALYDPTTGEAAVFTPVTNAAASTQVRALRREQLKAEVRAVLIIDGTTPSFTCGVYLAGLSKYAGGW